jgi:hypothetical protein
MDGQDQRTAPEAKEQLRTGQCHQSSQWSRWQQAADSIWKAHPNLSRHSVARLVKKQLNATQQTDSIARRIRK